MSVLPVLSTIGLASEVCRVKKLRFARVMVMVDGPLGFKKDQTLPEFDAPIRIGSMVAGEVASDTPNRIRPAVTAGAWSETFDPATVTWSVAPLAVSKALKETE